MGKMGFFLYSVFLLSTTQYDIYCRLFLADSTPEWEDPELQREIQAATGIDLKRKGKGKGRVKSSNLTDLRESGSSSRKRLESKIFKRYDLAWIHNYRACESVTTKR